MTFHPLPTRREEIQLLDGYFSKAVYFRSQPAGELERRIGYRAGRLAAGWWLMFLTVMPAPGQFQYRGYSQMAGGIEQGHLAHKAGGPTAEDRLQAGGFNLTGTAYQKQGLKQKTIAEVFSLHGPERLAKVRPVASMQGDPDSPEFPPGSGIPQWTLTQRLPWVAVAFIAPGEVYMGNYS